MDRKVTTRPFDSCHKIVRASSVRGGIFYRVISARSCQVTSRSVLRSSTIPANSPTVPTARLVRYRHVDCFFSLHAGYAEGSVLILSEICWTLLLLSLLLVPTSTAIMHSWRQYVPLRTSGYVHAWHLECQMSCLASCVGVCICVGVL
jgi:hypothetical protein